MTALGSVCAFSCLDKCFFCVADSIQHLVGQPQNGNESSRNSIVMLVELELSGRQVGSATADDVGVG